MKNKRFPFHLKQTMIDRFENESTRCVHVTEMN